MSVGDAGETRVLLAASHLLESPEDRQAARAFLAADSSLHHVRAILGPVLLEEPVHKFLGRPGSMVPELLSFARDLLSAEVARPLRPYPDWRRPCSHLDGHPRELLHELIEFMEDPDAETHRFSRAQGDRTLLEAFIRNHDLDLDHVTITKGRPYTLACTKNDRSHQRALATRAQDEALLAKLAKLPGAP